MPHGMCCVAHVCANHTWRTLPMTATMNAQDPIEIEKEPAQRHAADKELCGGGDEVCTRHPTHVLHCLSVAGPCARSVVHVVREQCVLLRVRSHSTGPRKWRGRVWRMTRLARRYLLRR